MSVCSSIRGGFRGGGHQAREPLFLLVKFFRALYLPLYQYLLQNQFMYRSKMSIVCVFVTDKIQSDNTSTQHTCPTLGRYAHYACSPPPPLKNSGPAPE